MNADQMIAYISSSVASVFEASHTPLFTEGEIDDPFALSEDVEYELRITNYKFSTSTKNNHSVVFNIDLLIKSRIDPENPYAIKSLLGAAVSTFAGVFTIRRYGTDPGDDESIIDCLKRVSDIDADDLGQVDSKVNIVFGQVSANYSLTWSE